jgi:peptide/nickel transport system substrate-binding protein
MSSPVQRSRSPRRARAFAAAAVLVLGLTAACTAGSSVTPTSTTSTPATSSSSAGSSNASSESSSASGSGSAAPSSSSAAPVTDASLAIGFTLPPDHFDFTQKDGAGIPQLLLTNVYETLVKLNQNGEIVPSLADSYTVSADRKTYDFKLHAGVKFSNGADFTADDAKFSIDRVKTAWVPSIKNEMNVVASTKVVSPTELQVTLSQPSNGWLFDMTGRVGAMFSRTGVSDLATTAIGTGPYTVGPYTGADTIVLTRNDSYWGQEPSVKTVTFKYYADPTAMNNALLTNSIQVVSSLQSPETIDQFKDTSKYQIIQGSTDGEVMMSLNDGKAPLNDVRVRQAINYALDKKAILDGAWSGYGTVIGSHESPNDPWFVDESNKYPHDVAKAKQLLAEAGQTNLKLSLSLPPVGYASAAAPIIVSELADAGITVTTSNVTWEVWLDKVFAKSDYDMTIINHVEPRDIGTIWGNPDYYTHYDNPKVQQLLKEGDAGTPEQYVADYKQVVQILADDAAAAWLWSFPNLMVADVDVHGLPKNAVGESFVLADLSVS